MMAGLLRPLLAILFAIALVVAPAAQATSAAACDAMHGVGADHRASSDHAHGDAPCGKMAPACVNAPGCASIVNLPAPAIPAAVPLTWTRVAYWAAPDAREGLSLAPAIGPPIPFA